MRGDSPLPAAQRTPPRRRGSAGRDGRRAGRVRLRRAGLAAGVAALLLITTVAGGSHGGAPKPGTVLLRSGAGVIARVSVAPFAHAGRLDRATLDRRIVAAIPAGATAVAGSATVEYSYDRAAAAREVSRIGLAGGTVSVARQPVAATIQAPVVTQRESNDCEATALAILLATEHVNVDQLTLQAELPRSGPLDPVMSGAGEVWGDPELGFVGRPDGAGPSGGYGVYQGPVRQLAARYGRHLTDLTGSGPHAVYASLLAGHAVLAWVGLSAGPYGSWHSPSGKPVMVNFGEHAVVLAGISRTGMLSVRNPLVGSSQTWTEAQFESMWALLGRRALAAA